MSVEPVEPLENISYFIGKISEYKRTAKLPDNQLGMADYYAPFIEYYNAIKETAEQSVKDYKRATKDFNAAARYNSNSSSGSYKVPSTTRKRKKRSDSLN